MTVNQNPTKLINFIRIKSSTVTDHQHASRFSYPIFLDLHGLDVLVVGGGRIGARKAEGLVAAGAQVHLVAIEVGREVDQAPLAAVHERAFDASDIEGMRLVITATGDVDIDRRIASIARSANVWTNAADQPVDCEFILPAITRAGRVTGAISTDGASPALAGYLRDRLAAILTSDIGRIAEVLAAERSQVKADGGSTEHIDWRPRIEELVAAIDREQSD